MKTISDRQDAYGHEVYDYYCGIGEHEIIERDDGHIDASHGLRRYFAQHADWNPQLKQALGRAKGRAIDIGCGPGRVAIHLQNQGMDVLGIDNSPLAIKVARLRGLRKARVMSITQVSRRLGIFDTILMCGGNFGLFGGFNRAKALLRRFHKMTGDGAVIIAETRDPYKIDDPVHKAYHRRNRRRGRPPARRMRIRVRYKNYIGPWFDYLFVSKEEMRKVLEGTGWRVAKFFESGEPEYAVLIEKKK